MPFMVEKPYRRRPPRACPVLDAKSCLIPSCPIAYIRLSPPVRDRDITEPNCNLPLSQPDAIQVFRLGCSPAQPGSFIQAQTANFPLKIGSFQVDMETIISQPVQDGEQPKSVKHAISQVVKSTFLEVAEFDQNSNNSKGDTTSKVQQFEAELEIQKEIKRKP